MQAAAAAERPVRHVAIEAAKRVVRVLREVRDAVTVERDGFVLEAAHADDRLGLPPRTRIDLEDVAVRLADRLELSSQVSHVLQGDGPPAQFVTCRRG